MMVSIGGSQFFLFLPGGFPVFHCFGWFPWGFPLFWDVLGGFLEVLPVLHGYFGAFYFFFVGGFHFLKVSVVF